MLRDLIGRLSSTKAGQSRNRSGLFGSRRLMKSTALMSLVLALLLSLSSLTLAAPSTPIYLGFTSDVHGEFTTLGHWLGSIKTWLTDEADGATLDKMIFGGDYPDRQSDAASWTAAQSCMNAVRNVFDSDLGIVLVRGNHDDQSGDYSSGLLYNPGDDYAIYVLDSSNKSHLLPEIAALDIALADIPDSVPVFVLSHCPIHYG